MGGRISVNRLQTIPEPFGRTILKLSGAILWAILVPPGAILGDLGASASSSQATPTPRRRSQSAPKRTHLRKQVAFPQAVYEGPGNSQPPPKTERRVSLRVGRGPERGAPHILDKALEIWLLGFLGIVIIFCPRVFRHF